MLVSGPLFPLPDWDGLAELLAPAAGVSVAELVALPVVDDDGEALGLMLETVADPLGDVLGEGALPDGVMPTPGEPDAEPLIDGLAAALR